MEQRSRRTARHTLYDTFSDVQTIFSGRLAMPTCSSEGFQTDEKGS